MFCNKCGNEISPNQEYCNKCGNHLTYNIKNTNNNLNNNNINYNTLNYDTKKKNLIQIAIIAGIIILILLIFSYIIISKTENNYYFDDGSTSTDIEPSPIQQKDTNTEKKKKRKYKTAIITDNVYADISVNNIDDANKLIIKDSINQKKKDYPKEILEIENEIIDKYSITAVNLKEMDVEFAKELKDVIKKIYEEYPGARGHLSNLTLTNLDMSESNVIALFMPVFTFGISDTSSTMPWVIKTQVQLNSKYFLNPEKMETTVKTSSKSGHFPKNATKYSPVAHELGHYLSFITLLNKYSMDSIRILEDEQVQTFYDIYQDFIDGDFSKQMIEEAYQNYKNDYNDDIDFDEWRGKISEYALAKDDSGNYIYDETIAEAFHDVYLNNDNANIVSKYVVEVLKKYIEG